MTLFRMRWTSADYLMALDRLQRVTAYLTEQYSDTLTRPEAQAHFDAREIIMTARFNVLGEAESIWVKTRKAGS